MSFPTNENWAIAGFGWNLPEYSGNRLCAPISETYNQMEKPIARENKKWSG